MNEHLRRIKGKETYVHYLEKDVQNEVIKIISSAVQKTTFGTVTVNKYFSIITDCTLDIAHMEQMSTVIHFVDTTNSKDTINEHFVQFLDIQNTTGKM